MHRRNPDARCSFAWDLTQKPVTIRGDHAGMSTTQHGLVRRHVEWWADHVERRMLGNARRAKGHNVGPAKPPWSRARFLSYLWANAPDYLGAEELADTFERAIAAARGNPSRFRQEIEPVTRPT
jgi:hypothetical protein